jgi:hypothetical protein
LVNLTRKQHKGRMILKDKNRQLHSKAFSCTGALTVDGTGGGPGVPSEGFSGKRLSRLTPLSDVTNRVPFGFGIVGGNAAGGRAGGERGGGLYARGGGGGSEVCVDDSACRSPNSSMGASPGTHSHVSAAVTVTSPSTHSYCAHLSPTTGFLGA